MGIPERATPGATAARRDGPGGDAAERTDASGGEQTDAACSMEGWDAGHAMVAPRDQGTLILAQIAEASVTLRRSVILVRRSHARGSRSFRPLCWSVGAT